MLIVGLLVACGHKPASVAAHAPTPAGSAGALAAATPDLARPVAPVAPPAAALVAPATTAPTAPTSPISPISPAAAPQPAALSLGPAVSLPAAPVARNWDEFKRQAARRMVSASPQGSFMGNSPPILFAIPVLEVELAADGSVRRISVVRLPSNLEAVDTVASAQEAIRRAAPYGDVSRLPKPWKWTEVFLFNEQRQFKPRTLD